MLSVSIAAFLAWALQCGKEKSIEQEARRFSLGLKPSVMRQALHRVAMR